MEIKVLKWNEFQTRKTKYRCSWFKLHHDMASSAFFWGLDDGQFRAWIAILSECSKHSSDTILINEPYFERVYNLKKGCLLTTIEKLQPKYILPTTATGLRQDCDRNVTVDKIREDKIREDKKILSSSATTESVPLAKIWNENCGSLPRVQVVTGKRKAAAEARWKENPSTEYWTEIVQRVGKSAFLTGQSKGGWRANFDFLIRPDTHVKISEGQYDGEGKRNKTAEEILRGA